ncbi:tetratricopeptide repeat protein [Alkalilacustris brevis]|uniref:tetratricopeptide repeat protein n=1 Tax=Alkalilacustris brevis TaxID=2026338 RepID=UPI000E0CF689|nr:tetratricopeptide repeat protein [Alkalilacustris brevis]
MIAPLPALGDEGGVSGAYLAARQALISNDYTAAAPYLDLVLAHEPENAFLTEGALQAHLGLGNLERAAELAEALAAMGIESQAGRLVLTAEALAQSAYDEALDLLEDEALSGPLVAGLLNAWIHLGEGRMSDTLAGLDALTETPGMQAFALYHNALALAYAGDFEGAEHILSGEAAGTLRVGRRGVVARLQVLAQLGNFDEALEFLGQAFGTGLTPDVQELRAALEAGEAIPFDIVTSPQDGMAEVYYDVAQTLQGEASPDYTLIYARLALHLRPGHADAMLLVAQLLEAMEQYDLAVEAYRKVPEDHPSQYRAALGKAEALYRAGQVETALDVLRPLAERHEDLPSIQVTLGDILRRESLFDEASQAYDRAIALLGEPEPRHWPVYYSRAITHERESRWELAEPDFRKALDLNPDQPHVLNYLGYSLVERGENLEEALEMIERAVEGEPESGYIIDSLAWALFRLGRYEEAVEPMERAVELLPRDAILNDHLGDVYWAVGRKLEARFQWRRALSFGPADDLDMDRIRRKLEVGLDEVLVEEGAEPLHSDVRAHGN